MSLASASWIAQSGLSTVTSEISVSSRNISGANATSSYSRKIANVVTLGTGESQVASITQAQDQAVFNNVLSATAASATQNAIADGLTQLNNTIGDVSSSTSNSQTSPAALLSNFQDALQSLEASPSSATLATAAVTAAGQLTSGLNSATATVQQVREQADSGMASAVQTINSLLSQFQTANNEIVQGNATGADVTDAEDSRNSILTQLSQQIGITTTTAADGDMAIYTDSGATLYQGGPRTVSFSPTSTFSASTTGNAVYVDGVAVTGAGATMPITSGALAGLATLRDDTTVTYQAQLDSIAGALVNTFGETDQTGSGPELPGLFTTAGATAMPASTTGLAGQIIVNPTVDPSQGGNAMLLRDGGISDTANSDYTYNTSADASYSGRLSQLATAMSQTQSFSTAGQIDTSATLSDYAADSVSWLEGQRSTVASQSDYQSTLLSTATTALSNATGVNLDDEMSKMLDLENSYSASAKLITTIDTMFGNLLSDISAVTS